ncbi:MAG TPA: hypothetical protein VF575_02715 [Candidatus Saccharimonadales bacterium]|jgi:hypothetical protein
MTAEIKKPKITSTHTKTKELSSYRKRGSISRRIIYVVLVSLLLLVVSVVVTNRIKNTIELNNFEETFNYTSKVSAAIEQELGSPLSSESIRGCSAPHQKLKAGPLSCHVGRALIYDASSPQAVEMMTNRVHDSLAQRKDLIGDKLSTDPGLFYSETPKTQDVKVVSDTFAGSTTNMRICFIVYYYYSSLNGAPPNRIASSKSAYNLQVSVECQGPARSQYYPRSDI